MKDWKTWAIVALAAWCFLLTLKRDTCNHSDLKASVDYLTKKDKKNDLDKGVETFSMLKSLGGRYRHTDGKWYTYEECVRNKLISDDIIRGVEKYEKSKPK